MEHGTLAILTCMENNKQNTNYCFNYCSLISGDSNYCCHKVKTKNIININVTKTVIVNLKHGGKIITFKYYICYNLPISCLSKT